MRANIHLSTVAGWSLFLIMIGIGSCDDGPLVYPRRVDSNPFDIRVGTAVTVPSNALVFGFDTVLSDSRCPEGAICAWEGKADASCWFVPGARDTIRLVLTIFGYVSKRDTAAHVTKDTLGYRFTLMQLDPYPRLDVKTDPRAYVATVRIRQ